MFVVYFFEERNLLLCQYRKSVPAEGEALTVKGRKGKVSRVDNLEDGKVHVHMVIDVVTKAKAAAVDPKKKRR